MPCVFWSFAFGGFFVVVAIHKTKREMSQTKRERERARDDGEVDGARLLLSIANVAAFAVRAAGQTASMREGEKRVRAKAPLFCY